MGSIGDWRSLSVMAIGMMVPASASAFRAGPPAGRNGSTASGGATCMQCHGNAVSGGSVQILGVPPAYEPDAIYALTVRIQDDGQAGAGFQISVEDPVGNHVGDLNLTDAVNTRLNSGWVNHTGEGVDDSVTNWSSLGDAAEYHVEWQAPSSDIGPVTFWAVGNAINDNRGTSGDVIHLTNSTIEAVGAVPTVSDWGLFILMLSILIAGTLVATGPRQVTA